MKDIREILHIFEIDQQKSPIALTEKVLAKYSTDIEAVIPYWQAGYFATIDPFIDLAVGFIISQYNIWLVNKKMEENPAFRKRHFN